MKIMIIALLAVVLISGCVVVPMVNDNVSIPNNNDAPDKIENDFCGSSTNGRCDSDSDCIKAGCSGQLCQSKYEEPRFSTCELRDCYNANVYGLFCKCVDGGCEWVE